MKVGLVLGDFAWDGGAEKMAETIVQLAVTADQAGFYLIGVGDHLWQGPQVGGPELPYLECFTTLSLIAASTTRCLVAPLVSGVHFRPPALLAKTLTTLDVLSGGRAMLGIGAGWDAAEAQGMGVAFPPLRERFGMLEETIQICLQLWQGEQGDGQPFLGQHYQLGRALNVPQSLSRPHPPILIGGEGERQTLRLVAQYADACNIFASPNLPGKLEVLRQHCAELGRDYDSIEKTCIVALDPATEARDGQKLAAQLQQLADWGVESALYIVSGPRPTQLIERIGLEVLPQVAGLKV